jgi:hypothetical protein
LSYTMGELIILASSSKDKSICTCMRVFMVSCIGSIDQDYKYVRTFTLGFMLLFWWCLVRCNKEIVIVAGFFCVIFLCFFSCVHPYCHLGSTLLQRLDVIDIFAILICSLYKNTHFPICRVSRLIESSPLLIISSAELPPLLSNLEDAHDRCWVRVRLHGGQRRSRPGADWPSSFLARGPGDY